jgi:hypothetical protein
VVDHLFQVVGDPAIYGVTNPSRSTWTLAPSFRIAM